MANDQLIARTRAIGHLEIPKDAILDGSNYTDWKLVVISVLQQYDLMFAIQSYDPTQAVVCSSVKTFLLFSMNRDHRNKINHCSTAHEIWQAITSIYENKSTRAVTMLWKRLFQFKIASYQQVNDGISEMQTIVSDLKGRNILVDDSCLIGAIESALPDEFKEWSLTWSMREKEPTINELINAINNHLETLKSSEAHAMFAKSGKPDHRPNKSKESGSKDDKFCKYCKKGGHTIEECRKLKRKKAEEGKKDSKDSKDSKSKTPDFSMVASMSSTISKSEWLADSGCSIHLTNNRNWISDYTQLITPIKIHLGDDSIIEAKGYGDVRTTKCTIRNVHFAPDVVCNLFSIASATDQGVEVHTDRKGMIFSKNGIEIISSKRVGKAYILKFDVIPTNSQRCAAATLEQWHQRFGHTSLDTLKRMQASNAVIGLQIQTKTDPPCEDCALNKCTAASHPTRTSEKSTKAGAVLHVDTAGPASTVGVGGARFLLICKDEHSGFRMVSCLRAKSLIPEEVKRFISQTELDTGHAPLKLISDNGSEFLSERLTDFLRDRGIIHQLSANYTPQQNGTIEREIRTTIEAARTLLNASGLSHSLWPEAVKTAAYVLNRSLARNKTQTAYEMWHGSKPNVKNLKIFGQHASVLIDKRSSKLTEKGLKLIFVGYASSFNTYRFFNPPKDQIITSCNAKFLDAYGPLEVNTHEQTATGHAPAVPIVQTELLEFYSCLNQQSSTPNQVEQTTYANLPGPNISPIASCPELHVDDTNPTTYSNIAGEQTNSAAPAEHQPTADQSVHTQVSDNAQSPTFSTLSAINSPQHSIDNSTDTLSNTIIGDQRSIPRQDTPRPLPSEPEPVYATISEASSRKLRDKRPINYKSLLLGKHFANYCHLESDDPTTFEEAMQSSDSNKWREAMEEEIAALNKCQVWELTNRPNRKIVTCRWVFKSKRSPDNEITRYRARLVARGFTQEKGRDYTETYAPVCDISAIRLLFAFAAEKHLLIRQFDVKTAFLYGELQELVLMEQPPGFETGDNQVYRLKKSLYGLKQASKQWNTRFSSFLTNLKLEQCRNDSCIFIQKNPFLILAIYVDDGIILAKDQSAINTVISQLKSEFEIHSVDSDVFLGFQYKRNPDGSISLHQSAYIHKLIARFGMETANQMDTPEATTGKPIQSLSDPIGEDIPFREAIGGLLYAAVTTRLDIAHAVARLARASPPLESHWMMVKRVIRYLKGSIDIGITYHPGQSKLYGYCDASFGDIDCSKSTTGYVFTFAGGPVSWRSKKQSLSTTSSTESELVSLCSATKEAIWLKNLAMELNIVDSTPVDIFCDNTSTIRIIDEEKAAKRTRHLRAQIEFPKEHVELGTIDIKHIPGKDQLADILTKPLGPQKFIPNRDKLMSKLILTIACLGILTDVMHCERPNIVSPIVYGTTPFIVEDRIIDYEIEFTHLNPCTSISNPKDSFWGVFNGGYRDWETLKRQCNKMYEEEWMTKMRELHKLHSRRGYTKRQKRGIIGDVVLGSGAYMLGVSTSNLFKSVASWFGYRDPQEERIHELETHHLREAERIAEFESAFNITRHINLELIKSIKDLSIAVENDHREIQKIAQEELTLTWTITYLQGKIKSNTNLLDAIIAGIHNQRIATRQMGEMINMTAISILEEKHTMFKALQIRSNRTVTFKFAARFPSYDTSVHRMVTFSHWIDLGSDPKLMEYRGMDYAIYNKSNQCIKGIEKPTDDFVIDECLQPNYVDPRVNTWQQVQPEPNKVIPYPVTHVRTSPRVNYIYCYMENITIDGIVQVCPPEVFSLPIETPFNIGGIQHRVSQRKLAILKTFEPAIDKIHPLHFTETLADPGELVKNLTVLRHHLDSLEELQNKSIIIPRPELEAYHYTAGISITTVILILILVLIMYQRVVGLQQGMAQGLINERSDSYELRRPNYAPPLPPSRSNIKGACCEK